MKEICYIDVINDLGSLLLSVEKPARYTGGEYGRLSGKDKCEKSVLKTLIAFPDLYEIGMSNQALRIIYNGLNRMEGISCDRSFAPAPDFEILLKNRALPLYGLDSGISLKDVDLLMFTLGYELSITGVLAMLDISGIPLHSSDRGEDDPVVVMGGPCVSNPLPYSDFIDAFWMGEAEGGFFDLCGELRDIKSGGLLDTKKPGRNNLLSKLTSHPSVWASGKGRAVRAVDAEFSTRTDRAAIFPVPSLKVVHHHGTVEIMRGCPNGCRFCHAGYWYRPMRQKNAAIVERETEAFIKTGGYREITLSSLSSGDYSYLEGLIDSLNKKFGRQHISFQLPSLKVGSFSLNLLEKISVVRKSGLTFAVETPDDFCQLAINKRVSEGDVVSILREAKRRGWKGAKFYFMVGLPLENLRCKKSLTTELESEEEEIAAFIERLARQTGMHFNINVGTFVPKPHTPFQWAKQLCRGDAEKKLVFLRERLKRQGHKVGIQDPLISVIEGLASRGDRRAGAFFEEAYKQGCRLDAWTEHLKREVWEELLDAHKGLVEEFLKTRDTNSVLPWSFVESRVQENFFVEELERANDGEVTSTCIEKCNNRCKICTGSIQTVKNTIHLEENYEEKPEPNEIIKKADPATFRIIFSFSKQGTAVFHPHLGILEIFFMAFIRAGIPVLYSQGFNPLPALEITSPLSLGIRACGEMAAIDTEGFFAAEEFKSKMNAFLPEGFEIVKAMNVYIPSGAKKHSLSSLLWGFVYAGENGKEETIAVANEKSYRETRIGPAGNIYGLERLTVLARPGVSYFEAYRGLYPGSGQPRHIRP